MTITDDQLSEWEAIADWCLSEAAEEDIEEMACKGEHLALAIDRLVSEVRRLRALHGIDRDAAHAAAVKWERRARMAVEGLRDIADNPCHQDGLPARAEDWLARIEATEEP